jgi:hypothetical protein
MSIASVRDALRVAHARYWGLIRPATLAAPLAEAHRQQAGSAAVPDALAPLQDARVVLSVIQDAGRVPSPFGGFGSLEGSDLGPVELEPGCHA